MPEIDIDLSEAKELVPVDDGAYEVIIEEEPITFEAQDSGLPCLKWEFRITDADGQEAFAGRKLWRNTPIVGEGAGFTEDMLRGFGITHESSGEGKTKTLRFRTEDAVGKRGIAKVTHKILVDKDTGEKRVVNNVKSISTISAEE